MAVITPSEVSNQLSIQPSTLRKYSLKLEEYGVQFDRNANNSRKYTAMDVVTLQKMITLMQTNDMTLDNAAYTVAKGIEEVASTTDDIAVIHDGEERYNDDIAPTLISEIRSLKSEIIEQRETIDGFRIAQEKRDAYFVEILEGLQEEIHRLNEQAALPAPEPEPEPEVQAEPLPEKKGFFARMFNK